MSTEPQPQPEQLTQEQASPSDEPKTIILWCSLCKARLHFTFNNRKPSHCVFCGARCDELIEKEEVTLAPQQT